MLQGFRAAWGSLPKRKQGIALASLTLLIWSFWPVWTRHGVTQGLSPEDIVLLRFGIGGAVFLPFLVRQAKSIPRRAWLAGFGLAVCQGAPFVLLMATGLRFAPANHAASLATGASPLFAAVIAAFIFSERVARTRWLGLLLVLGSAAAIASIGGPSATGHVCFFAAAAMAAIYIVCVPRSGLTAFQAAALVSVFSMLLYLPVYFIFGLGRLAEVGATDIIVQGAYQGILVAVVSFVCLNAAIARLGSAQISVVIALLPVLTLGLAIPVLGEWPSALEALSALVISVGVGLASSARGPTARAV